MTQESPQDLISQAKSLVRQAGLPHSDMEWTVNEEVGAVEMRLWNGHGTGEVVALVPIGLDGKLGTSVIERN